MDRHFQFNKTARSRFTSILRPRSEDRIAARTYRYAVRSELTLLHSIERIGIDFSQLFESQAPHVTARNSLSKEISYHHAAARGLQKITSLDSHALGQLSAASGSHDCYDSDPLKLKTGWDGNVISMRRVRPGRILHRSCWCARGKHHHHRIFSTFTRM